MQVESLNAGDQILVRVHSAPPSRSSVAIHPATILGTGWEEALQKNELLASGQDSYVLASWSRAGIILGPLVIPGQTPCLRCLDNMIDLAALHERFVPLSILTDREARAAASALVRFLACHNRESLLGRMVLLGADESPRASIRAARFPACADCHPDQQPTEVYYATQLFMNGSERA